jgi:Tol biopolymer transport system component
MKNIFLRREKMITKIRFRAIVIAAILIICFGALPDALDAQYFGRNKVQYEKFDFKVMKTEHFDVYFYPEMTQAAEQAARMAERWYARLSRLLNYELRGRQPLILYAASPHFQQTTALPGVIGEGTGGVTESGKRRIILPLGPSLEASDHVIGHELVHAFQYDMTSFNHSPMGYSAAAVNRIPLWMVEGMAEYLAHGPKSPLTSMWMRDATQREEVPHLAKMDDPRYFPYRWGHSFWAYVTGKYGDQAVGRIMRGIGRVGDYRVAVEKALGISLDDLSNEWQAAMQEKYEIIAQKTTLRDEQSELLIEASKKNMYNVSPSISPDGKKVVFFSARDLFSMDLYMIDVETKKVEKKLVNMALSAHFESLQFIKSSGTWGPEGKRFAFAAISKGQPVLTIINAEGRKENEYKFKEIGEIFNPTWSPDGKKIAFAGLVGGFTDLFIYDLENEQLRRMTDDPYSALQPAWSPNGNQIAFVTERFNTDLAVLDIGHLELAVMDANTGEITRLPSFEGASNYNPQWTPDSESIAFLSDRNGIPNLYRLYLDSGEIRQISNLYTGVSGITETSPALSVAQKSGRIVYSYYEKDMYSLYTRDVTEEEAAGLDSMISFDPVRPEVLPPREESEGDLSSLLKNPIFGLPDEAEFPVEDYRAKLKLDYITPPTMAIGVDRFGTYAGGGIAMFFSDMLGHHSLSTSFAINSRIIDSTVLVGYQNSSKRLNWGGAVQRVSYPYAYYFMEYDENEIREVEWINRQINYQIAGYLWYPFNQVSRLEFSGGYRMIDFDQELRIRAYDPFTGENIDNRKEKLPSPDTLYLPYVSTAFVHDNSFFGATAPILGQTAIMQVAPLFGSIQYVGFLADFRKYFMPVRPFTLAFRLMHTGRYGSGEDDPRLYPLFMGYENLVRGYSYYSFSNAELASEENREVYNSLFGSKMAVFNAEIRFPLFGALGIGRGFYGILPIDFLAFFDGGLAWDSENQPFFAGGDRDPVFSTGVGLRMNLFGYMIIGAQFAYPFNRPDKGFHFQITFYPGF